MHLTSTSKLNLLRAAIYAAAGVAHYSKSYRTRKLRKVCEAARGLDLRRRKDVVLLAQRLNLIAKPAELTTNVIEIKSWIRTARPQTAS